MKIQDPAWGDSKQVRAGLGGVTPKNSLKAPRSRVNQFRYAHTGQFDGPRPTYGRYNVSEQSADILNRQIRNMDMR